MKAIVTRSPGGLDCLELRELPDPASLVQVRSV
jgi:hypothetical protein